jgi:hypothetical protein
MEGSRISILRDPFFRPIFGPHPDVFRMTDLLKIAYDATRGEIRPLSPNAPQCPRALEAPIVEQVRQSVSSEIRQLFAVPEPIKYDGYLEGENKACFHA